MRARLERLIDLALDEDLAFGDVTSRAIFPAGHRSRAVIRAGQDLVVCGLDVAAAVFERVDSSVRATAAKADGDRVRKGAAVLRLAGPTASLLAAERTALNFLQRLCGIATLSRRFAVAARGSGVRIVDTRKTTPGHRALEKYAVRCGGCHNHRSSLGEHVLIKDNHIAAAGSIARAVKRAREAAPHTARIEVEAATPAQVREAVRAGADAILLDNMTPKEVRAALAAIGGRALVEVSGGMTLDTIPGYLVPGVDVISVGALTHSAPAADLEHDTPTMKVCRCDCVVIGSGLAGSAYALHASRAGLTVELLSIEGPRQTNSDRAQGGIVYDLSGEFGGLAGDIEAASGGTTNPAAVRQLVAEGPEAVKELLIDELHVGFDRAGDGRLDFTKEGGHGRRRIIHASDETGRAIVGSLAESVEAEAGIERRIGFSAVSLIVSGGRGGVPACRGTYALDLATNEMTAFVAKKTILATGGLGGIYLHTTNHPETMGQGIAMAAEAGARLANLEFIQFHPTTFFSRDAPRFLITEALRGEGAVLVDKKGNRFMDAAHPLGSLAPRDIVARAIHRHMEETGDECVYLDLSGMAPGFARRRFPLVFKNCLAHGVNMELGRIPVAPAAHYSCGGVRASLEGRTNVRHLNAIGEVACTGLHGANRLASTSLLECVVGARAAARADALEIADGGFEAFEPHHWDNSGEPSGHTSIVWGLQKLRETLWHDVGIIRTTRGLKHARDVLTELRVEITPDCLCTRLTREFVNLWQGVHTGLLVVEAALKNPFSQGCHFISKGSG